MLVLICNHASLLLYVEKHYSLCWKTKSVVWRVIQEFSKFYINSTHELSWIILLYLKCKVHNSSKTPCFSILSRWRLFKDRIILIYLHIITFHTINITFYKTKWNEVDIFHPKYFFKYLSCVSSLHKNNCFKMYCDIYFKKFILRKTSRKNSKVKMI